MEGGCRMPMLCTCFRLSSASRPARLSDDWIHEVKYDGYRLRVERDGDRIRLITRNGYDWTSVTLGSSRQR